MISRTLRLARRLLRIAALADRIEHLKKKYPAVADKVEQISEYDPTGGKFLEWLVKVFADKSYPVGFWNASKEILQVYADIIKSPSLAEMYGVSRDINQMSPKALYDIWFQEYRGLEGLGNESTASQALRAKKVKEKGSRVIYEQNGYRVVQFGGSGMDQDAAVEALCMFGAGTSWCTRKSKQAKDYLSKRPVYMIFKGPYKIAQMSGDEITDPENKGVSLKENMELAQVLAESGALSPKDAYYRLSRGWGEKGPLPEFEPALARDPETAYRYAYYYLHGRFPLGEKAIAQDPMFAYTYAVAVLEDRFPEGEKAILSDPEYGPKYKQYLDEGYFDFLRQRREKKQREQLQNV